MIRACWESRIQTSEKSNWTPSAHVVNEQRDDIVIYPRAGVETPKYDMVDIGQKALEGVGGIRESILT
jgi:hypothetical protein